MDDVKKGMQEHIYCPDALAEVNGFCMNIEHAHPNIFSDPPWPLRRQHDLSLHERDRGGSRVLDRGVDEVSDQWGG
jgi:hypothetical protein